MGKGIFKDIENKKLIAEILKKFTKIHGVLIFMNVFESQLSPEFKYNLNETLMLLHCSAISNIIFVLTNSRGHDYAPGLTLPTLKKYFIALKENTMRTIELNERNVFCIDNEGYLFQCGWTQNKEFQKEMSSLLDNYKASWELSKRKTIDILKFIVLQNNAHDTRLSCLVTQTQMLLHDRIDHLVSILNAALLLSTIRNAVSSSKEPKLTYILENINSVLQNENHKLLYQSFFTFQKYIDMDSVLFDVLSSNQPCFNIFIKNLPIFKGIVASTYLDGYNYSEKHIRVKLKPKHDQIFNKIITQELKNDDENEFFNMLLDTIKKQKKFIEDTVLSLTCYLKNDAILCNNESNEEMIAAEIKARNDSEAGDEHFTKFQQLDNLLNLCKFENKRIHALINTEQKKETEYDEFCSGIYHLPLNGITTRKIGETKLILSKLTTLFKTNTFPDHHELLLPYYLKFKASIYFSSKSSSNVIFISKNVSEATPFLKAMISISDCFLSDDCFAFLKMKFKEHFGLHYPKRYFLMQMEKQIKITSIPCSSKFSEESELLKTIIAKVDEIKGVWILIKEKDSEVINLNEYLGIFPNNNLSMTYFFYDSKSFSPANKVTDVIILLKDAVERYNNQHKSNIKFYSENVYVFNSDAFELIAEIAEKEENIMKIDERFFEGFKFSIQELHRFLNSLNTIDQSTTKKSYSIPCGTFAESQSVDAVGIDLGTSRCCIAVNRKRGVEAVPIENTGERLLPSYVGYDEKNIKCGQVVLDRLRNFSTSTIFDSKRLIGKDTASIVIDRTWPFKVIIDDNKAVIKLDTPHGEVKQTPIEVAAVLLKYMKEKAEQFQGKKLEKVVITVPAAFIETQEEATREAAKLARWSTVVLLPEPIAASFAYFIDRPIPNNSFLLLFDLGGGTLDVCVFKIANNQIEVISRFGDFKVGGRDFDNLLMDYFMNKLNLDYNVSKLGNKKYKLLLECQRIKHNLSVRNTEQLDVDDFDQTKNGLIYITQENFQNLAEELLIRIKNTIFSALYNSGCKISQIDKVLQVGGGCRMPMIKELLNDTFPNAEHCCEEHPDEVVAIGAAYYACSIFSNTD